MARDEVTMTDHYYGRFIIDSSESLDVNLLVTTVISISSSNSSSSFPTLPLSPNQQVAQMFDQVKPAGGKFNYGKFTRIMKRGSDE